MKKMNCWFKKSQQAGEVDVGVDSTPQKKEKYIESEVGKLIMKELSASVINYRV